MLFEDMRWRKGNIFCDLDFSGADFSHLDFSSQGLWSASLFNANLSYSNFDNADLTSALLENADLRNASLYSADLSNANLTGANLTGANLTGANLTGAKYTTGYDDEDLNTKFPKGFEPKAHGMIQVDLDGNPIKDLSGDPNKKDADPETGSAPDDADNNYGQVD